jgi:copper chaperone
MSQAFRVKGMTCEGCARAVAGAIRAKVPSADVAIDLGKGTVTVQSGVDAKTIAAAIEGAGFDFAGPA